MAKQKKGSQDYCKENKQIPKQSQVNVHSRRQGECSMKGTSVKPSGIAVVCTWLFWADFEKAGLLC